MAVSRWLAPTVLAAALGVASFAPAPAHAQSYDLTRAIVDIADVVFRGSQPYDRYGDYGTNDRLVVGRDAYGRPVYYRATQDNRYNNAYRAGYVRNAAPYGYGQAAGKVKCNKHGKCKSEYYDPRYDRDGRYGDDGRYGYDDRRWRDRDDD